MTDRIPQNIIDVQNINVSYNGSETVLNDLSLQVAEGEWVLITGPSGCGKSTLARAISGIIPHAISAEIAGTLEVDGLNISNVPLPEIAQRVGMVFQNPSSQLFHLTVEDELAFGPRNLGLSENEVQRRVNWISGELGLDGFRKKQPHTLSNGQKQLIAISAVLSMQPKVLVLDEPLASLDISSTNRVMNALEQMNERFGLTIVMIEHRFTTSIKDIDRVCLMNAGRIDVQGPPAEVLADPKFQKIYGLRRIVDEPMDSWNALISIDKQKYSTRQSLLEFKHINAGYQGKITLKDINLCIYPGEFVSLVGDNGAGKSTLGLVAAGLLKPLSGKIIYQDGKKPQAGLDIALLFQNPQDQLFTNSVKEELTFAPENYNCFDINIHKALLKEADLDLIAEKHPYLLSMGQKLRTALASCVSIQPKLVILDEPTLGQDWEHLSRLMNYLKTLNDKGTAILLISHDYKLVHRYAHRVILIEGGRIKLNGHLSH